MSPAAPVVTVPFTGQAGPLDGRRHGDPTHPPLLLLHPHPRFGGTMGSRLVYDLAVALAQAGWCAYRFDFRGVGRSAGSHGDGTGETADALAVFAAVARLHDAPPVVIGYSFGGAVAIRLAGTVAPARLVTIGTPLRLTESVLRPVDDAPHVRCPTDLVVGDHDGFVPVSDAQALATAFSPPARLHVIADAAHFLEPSRNPSAVAKVLEILGPAGWSYPTPRT